MKIRFYRNINGIETIFVGDNDAVLAGVGRLAPIQRYVLPIWLWLEAPVDHKFYADEERSLLFECDERKGRFRTALMTGAKIGARREHICEFTEWMST